MPKFYFLPGDQVAYIPAHADNIMHPDVEFGFITSINHETDNAFVRYWSGTERDLRTTACSAATPTDRLIPHISVFYLELAEAAIKYVLPNVPDLVHSYIREDMNALRRSLSGERW